MSWKHKTSELLFEVFIIVVAVSISLLLERWREKSIEHTWEKEFLLGLRTDLTRDIQQMKDDSSSYGYGIKAYNFFIKSEGKFFADSANYYSYIYSYSTLQPNASRFEGLKSSGRLDIIENAELRQEIIRLYEEKIPSLKLATEFHLRATQQPLMDYVDHQVNIKQGAESISKAIAQTYPQNIFIIRRAYMKEIVTRYHKAAEASRKIVSAIDALKLEE